jgi:hypothetical protein
MCPRTRALLNHLDLHHAALRAAVDSVPGADRQRQPGTDRWSVAQVLEHLSIVEGRIAGMFAKAADLARANGKKADGEAELASGLLDLEPLLDRTERRVAGEASRPQGRLDAASALTRLEGERAKFRAAVIAADDLALDDALTSHPRLGALNMYQWVLFTGAHESRHAAQILEIGESLRSAAD